MFRSRCTYRPKHQCPLVTEQYVAPLNMATRGKTRKGKGNRLQNLRCTCSTFSAHCNFTYKLCKYQWFWLVAQLKSKKMKIFFFSKIKTLWIRKCFSKHHLEPSFAWVCWWMIIPAKICHDSEQKTRQANKNHQYNSLFQFSGVDIYYLTTL